MGEGGRGGWRPTNNAKETREFGSVVLHARLFDLISHLFLRRKITVFHLSSISYGKRTNMLRLQEFFLRLQKHPLTKKNQNHVS